MQPSAIIFQGDVEVAKRHLGFAAQCGYMVDSQKASLGTVSLTKEFDLPDGSGVVLVESMSTTTRIVISATGRPSVKSSSKWEEFMQIEAVRSRMVWLPEGFMITPRSPTTAPDGWGMPVLPDGKLTPGGPIRDVIINRFADNLYPDLQFRNVKGDPLAPFMPEAPFFTPESAAVFNYSKAGSIIGHSLRRVGAFISALLKTFAPQLVKENRLQIAPGFSEESDAWLCHRPEVVPYVTQQEVDDDLVTARYALKSDLLSSIFHSTNEYRKDVGQKPVFPPLRGWYTGMAESSIYEMNLSGALGHSSSWYRVGYKTLLDRTQRFGAFNGYRLYENAQIANVLTADEDETPAQLFQRQGELFSKLWSESPDHYAAMIFNYTADKPEWSGFLEIAAAGGVAVGRQEKPHEVASDPVLFEQPFSGIWGTQIFHSRDRWVTCGTAYWYGDLGVVSWASYENLCRGRPELYYKTRPHGANDVTLFIKGRVLIIRSENHPEVTEPYVLGAGMFSRPHVFTESELEYRGTLSEEGQEEFDKQFPDELFVSALALTTPNVSDPESVPNLLLYAFPIGDKASIIHTHPLPIKTYETLSAIFSPDGTKAVIRVCEEIAHPEEYLLHTDIDLTKTHTVEDVKKTTGSRLDFIEFVINKEALTAESEVIHSSQVNVVVSDVLSEFDPVNGHQTYGSFKQNVDATYKCYAAYDSANTVVYAENEVLISTNQYRDTINVDPVTLETTYVVELSTKATLHFPDGTSIIHIDSSGSFHEFQGFIKRFDHLDIMRPSEAITTTLTIVDRDTLETPDPYVPKEGFNYKYRLDIDVDIGATNVMSVKNAGLPYPDLPAYAPQGAIRAGDIAELVPFNGAWDDRASTTMMPALYRTRTTHYTSFGTYSRHPWPICKSTYAARLDDDSIEGKAPKFLGQNRVNSISPRCNNELSGMRTVVARYNGETLNAVRVHSVDTLDKASLDDRQALYGFRHIPRKVWQDTPPPGYLTTGWVNVGIPFQSPDSDPPSILPGTEPAHVVSSLNLKEITQIGDLDDDIFPMGVL